LRDGIRRVNRAPAVLLGVFAMTLLVSVPLAVAMRSLLAQHLGNSLIADSAASGVDYDWMQEFADQATGLGVTFKPTIIGFAAVLDNLSAFLDNTSRPVVIVAAASIYVIGWLFLAGGIIDRLARDRATRAHGFFAACGVHFFRFLRLAVVQWIVYALLFGALHPWLFERLYPRMIHEVTVERTAFMIRVALYLVFGAIVAAATIVFDYAKIRTVVEDRRSMLAAINAAAGFISRHLAAAVSLFLADFVLFLAVVALYGLIAPGGGGRGIMVWAAFAIGQLYIVARLWVKLVFWASETTLFQSRLAHAGYVSRAEPAWPDSPAADMM
ncbi:MAG TPA: hypothetical protein VKD69_26895, partial [Vicinamibacterales bacterium]|nr:hypothetical protein [Vicinamibacterales bacterium]